MVLYGSVADGSVRNLHFDIDLAVIDGDLSRAEAGAMIPAADELLQCYAG